MPWKYFQWKRWMALKKILCICLQNKAQGLDKDSLGCCHCKARMVTPVLVAEVALPCPAALELSGLQQDQQPQNSTCVVTQSGCVSFNCQPCHRATIFSQKWSHLVLLLWHWGHIQSTTHPQAPDMDPSSLSSTATRL